MGRAPPRLSVYPPLNPAAAFRRPARRLPFPLEEPGRRLYYEARQGLWWALQGLGIGAGDEVLVPAYHHGSEIEAVVRTGAQCRFYDCRGTYEPDEAELESLLGPRVRALYLIHPLGFAQDSPRWRRWCDDHGLLLLEDGAQAFLSRRDGRPVGADADLALFCLYKAFPLANGAAVVSSSFGGTPPHRQDRGARAPVVLAANWLAQRWRLPASLLRRRRRAHPHEERPDVDFALTVLDERPTAAACVLLPRVIDTGSPARRRANFETLAQRLEPLRSPTFATLPPESSPLAFPIEVHDKRAFVERLASSGIEDTRMWTIPHPAMDAAAHPGAAVLRSRLVGLPVHQELRRVDLRRIADEVLRAAAAV